MKRKIVRVLLPVVLLVLPVPMSAMAKVFYVQPPTVKVMAAPSFGAKVLGTVWEGYRFDTTGVSGKWLKFTYQGRAGYINAAQALPTPPISRPRAAQGTQRKLTARDRSSAAVAVAGVKGLTYEDRSRASKGERTNYEAVEKMEGFAVRPEEVKAFQEGGN